MVALTQSASAQEISSGGERVTHLYPNDCYYAHLSIYYFATQFVKNKVVLDAGSGAGYGSMYFAENGARQVVAVDVSDQAVLFSRNYFKKPNLEFKVMDLQKISGYPNNYFDFIFSSNTLEHIPDVPAFLYLAWKLLKPEGILVLAVPPITNEQSRDSNVGNPYHLNIWTPRQWYNVVSQYFGKIEPYRHMPKEKINTILDFNNTPDQTTINEMDFDFEPISIEQFYKQDTLTIIFVISKPREKNELSRHNTPLQFVEESFTRENKACQKENEPFRRLVDKILRKFLKNSS